MNYVSEPVNNCSGFACQPVRFNKPVYKQISSNVVNKPIPSVDASETFCAIVKCKNKFYDYGYHF